MYIIYCIQFSRCWPTIQFWNNWKCSAEINFGDKDLFKCLAINAMEFKLNILFDGISKKTFLEYFATQFMQNVFIICFVCLN